MLKLTSHHLLPLSRESEAVRSIRQNSSRRIAYLCKGEHDAQGNIYENVKGMYYENQNIIICDVKREELCGYYTDCYHFFV